MKGLGIWVVLGVAVTALIVYFFFINPITMPNNETIPDDADVEALARMIASENGGDPLIVQQAIAWTAVNMAARSHKSVADLVMPGGVPGPQIGRYASTARPATTATRSIAYDVLSNSVSDPTDGAIQFDAPRTQDLLNSRDPIKNPTADEIARRRMADGKEAVYLPGVDPRYMRWWRYA